MYLANKTQGAASVHFCDFILLFYKIPQNPCSIFDCHLIELQKTWRNRRFAMEKWRKCSCNLQSWLQISFSNNRPIKFCCGWKFRKYFFSEVLLKIWQTNLILDAHIAEVPKYNINKLNTERNQEHGSEILCIIYAVKAMDY